MNKDEALRMALDELCRVYHDDEAGPYTLEVIKTIKQVLEQPEPEPVAVVSSVAESGDKGVRVRWIGGFPQIGDRLYTSPPKREQEPVECMCGICKLGKREPLTEEQLDDLLLVNMPIKDHRHFARTIEAAHGIFKDEK